MKSNSPFRKTDPPGSEEKPGILDKIRNIASAVVSPKTTIAKSLVGAAKSKIAENLRPYGYGTDEDSAASRVLGSILKPEPGSVSHDKQRLDTLDLMLLIELNKVSTLQESDKIY